MSALAFPFKISNASPKRLDIAIRGTIGVPKAYEDYTEAGGTVSDFEKEIKNGGSDIEEIHLRITSRGGDIFVAAAIRDILESHPARVVAQVDGLAASAASWIILAADEVQVPANAWIVIHNPQSWESGDHRAFQKIAKDLEAYTNDIAREYAVKSRAVKGRNATGLKEWRRLMDETTRLNGKEAHELGLVDVLLNDVALSADIGGARAWCNGFPGVADEFLPPEVLKLFDNSKPITAENQKNLENKNPSFSEMKPEEIQSLVTNAIRDALKPVTDSIGAVENKVGAIDIKGAVSEGVKNLETKFGEQEKILNDFKARLETAEKVIKSGVSNRAGGGASIPDAGGGEGDAGEVVAPKNRAELDAALLKCSNFSERRALMNAFDKAQGK